MLLLLARTTPREHVSKRGEGLSVFLVDMRLAQGTGISTNPIRTMMNHATTALFFDDLRVPAENLVGEEGHGFRYILSGMNAERILIAAECIGDAKWFIAKAAAYAKERMVFDRPIGQNQGVQFPIARAYAQMRAAELMVHEAARRYQAGENCGAEANLAKLLAADASWAAADTCLQTHGQSPNGDIPRAVADQCFPKKEIKAHDPRFHRTRLKGILQGVSGVLLIVAWALGASLVGAEFSSRSMTTLLTWETRRTRVFGAKIAAVLITMCLFASVVLGLVAMAMLPARSRARPGRATPTSPTTRTSRSTSRAARTSRARRRCRTSSAGHCGRP